MLKKIVTITIACYNEQDNIIDMYSKLNNITNKIKKYTFEYIFVDNGSLDNTRQIIVNIAKKDKKVKGIFLSRNFGPEASLSASHDFSTGEAVISIPCDFQDPPLLIPKFIKKWEEGANIVIGIYQKSEEDNVTRIIRKIFYKLFKLISNIDIPINASGSGLLDKKALIALKSLPEKYRFFRGLRSWIGFKVSHVSYKKQKRNKGKSSYNFIDYVKHAERGMFGFSYLALDLMVYTGFFLVLLSFIFIIGYLYTVLVIGNPINASIPIMLVIVFFGGIQLLAISIIGKYIQVIVEETKARPIYIVEDTINTTKNNQ